MRVRWVGLFAGMITLCGVPVFAGQARPVEAIPKSRNVVMIVLDDMTSVDFNRSVMPNLFRDVVDRGMTFDNFVANTPLCGPTRATLLTGLYAHNHGVRFCDDVADASRLKFDAYFKGGFADNDLGAQMQRRGYYTAMIGKYLNSYGGNDVMFNSFGAAGHENYVPAGWSRFFVPVGLSSISYYGYEVVVDGVKVRYGLDDADFRTDVETRQAIQAAQSANAAGSPLMLNLWYFGPHQSRWSPRSEINAPRHGRLFMRDTYPVSPAVNEADFTDKPPVLQGLGIWPASKLRGFDILYRNRLRSLQSVDEGIADVVAHLKSIGQFENTYFVFLSDNGFSFGEHRLANKMNPYESSIRVPLVIAGPGVARGVVSHELAAMVDVYPTIFDLAFRRVPDVDGQSLRRLLDGSDQAANWRTATLIEDWADNAAQFSAETGNGYTITFDYRGLRLKDAKYIRWYTGDEEYYDLASDPFELDNVFPQLDPQRQEELRSELARMENCRTVECRDYGDVVPETVPVTFPNHLGSGLDIPPGDVVPASNPTIPVAAPLAGDALTRGTNVTFTWDGSAAPSIDTLRIVLSSPTLGRVTLAAAAPNTGSASIALPPQLRPGRYRLMISSNEHPATTSTSFQVRVVPAPPS